MQFIVNEPTSILDLLVHKLKLSSTTKARTLVKDGSVQIDGQVVKRADQIAQPGQTVQVKKDQKPFIKPPVEILHNDDALVVVVKPSGLLSVSSDKEKSQTLPKILAAYLREQVYIVHRLDREVSGIMVFAKSHEVQKKLEREWHNNEKKYLALVEGAPSVPEGTIESWLLENTALKVFSTKKRDGAKHAVTHYKVLRKEKNYTLIEVTLETGRKHQIRVHMADLGCPIVGDKKYGARSNPFKRIALHAFRFSFTHPTNAERMTFESPFPLRA